MKPPFELGVKLLFRLLIPGFFFILGFVPILFTFLDYTGWNIQREYVFSFGIVLMGWIIITLDMPIYMFFEGRRFWPSPWRRLFMYLETNRLKRNIKKEDKFYNLSTTQKGNEALASFQKSLEAWVEIRQFPMNDEGHYQALFPTRMGNLITAFESYPYTRYGMDSTFYSSRIWLRLSKDLKDEIDNTQALADCAVYSSFAFYISAFFWFIYAVSPKAQTTLIKYLPDVKFSWLLFFFFILLGYGAYRAAIYPQARYGEVFKSVFDTYQKDIDIDEIIQTVALLTNDSAIKSVSRDKKLKIAWDYLHNYRVQCPKCNKFVSPFDLNCKDCNHNIY
jgi:hypothetical protein